MFDPPVSTPTARMQAIAWSRSIWYWRSVSVCCGATVTESPVCTPIGSTFSIEQTITTLSLRSRISSSSNSPQPITDSSTRIWPIGLAAIPSVTRWRNSASFHAMPPPSPPIVNAGPEDRGQADLGERLLAVGDARDDVRARHAQARLLHRDPEEVAVLGALDRLVVGADQLDAEALEHAVLVQRAREVERGAAAERRQQRVGALLLDHARDARRA